MRTSKGPVFSNKHPRAVDSDDDESSDDMPISQFARDRRVKLAKTSSSAPEPVVIDMVNTGGCGKKPQEKAVESFAEYVDKIVSENETLKADVAGIKKVRDDYAAELAECLRDGIASDRVIADKDKRIAELSNMARNWQNRATAAEKKAQETERINGCKEVVDSVKELFHDIISTDTAVCPILLTNGRVVGFEQVVNFWLHSESFDGTASSMFTCPLTRQLIRIESIKAIGFVVQIASKLGLDLSMPFSFEFDRKSAPLDPEDTEHKSDWTIYSIEPQLHLFAAIVWLYRDRQFGPNHRTVQINNNHTVCINMGAGVLNAAGVHAYTIEMGLIVINDMTPSAHRIRYVKRPSAPNHLKEFTMV